MSKEKIDFILNRHCCRHFFKGENLKDGDLEILMEALRWAPSGGNIQPWFFYVVKREDVKNALKDAAHGQNFIVDASVDFVICLNADESAKMYGDRGKTLYCFQDTAAAVENLLLAATILGYGSCWIGAFNEDKVREALEIPSHLRPVAIIPVGPGQTPAKYPGRKPVSDIFTFVE